MLRRGVRQQVEMVRLLQLRCFTSNADLHLLEIGRLDREQPETQPYSVGQLFLHRSLGYRGIVVAPWATQMVQYATQDASATLPSDVHGRLRDVEEGLVKPAAFYQVLTSTLDDDNNDRLAFATQTWSNPQAKILGHSDYVHHDDMIPYSTQSITSHVFTHPTVDNLFNVFNSDSDGFLQYKPTEALSTWAESTLKSLANSRAYRASTRNVQVTVIPFFQGIRKARGSEADDKPYMWYYKVLIENKGDVAVQLVSRRWVVISQDGERNYLAGRGIVRQLPILNPKDRSFQFTSCISLTTPHGIMGGTFVMSPLLEAARSTMAFNVEIPTFSLDSHRQAGSDDQTSTESRKGTVQ